MKHLTPKEAWQRIAATSDKRKANGEASMPDVLIAKDDLYIFGDDGAAIITTAYEELPVVIGQWEDGEGEMPDALVELTEEYARQLEWWKTTGSAMPSDRRRAKSKAMTAASIAERQNIGMMLSTKWSQWSPWNDNCHYDGKACPCGCMPLAIAQLLYYWGKQVHDGKVYHRGCTEVKAYKTATNKWKVSGLSPITVFDYKHLVQNPKTKEEKEAVAQMVEYISKACVSDYTANGTSSNTSKGYYAIKDYIKLAQKPTMMYAQQVGEDTFEARVYKDIAKGLPVILSGTSKSSSHAFLIDGYKDGLYHVNWGWGGSYNGWFRLSALTPGTKEYNSYKCAILNINPTYVLGDVDGDGEVTVNDVMEAVNHSVNGTYNKKADVNNDGTVDINDVNTIANQVLKGEGL